MGSWATVAERLHTTAVRGRPTNSWRSPPRRRNERFRSERRCPFTIKLRKPDDAGADHLPDDTIVQHVIGSGQPKSLRCRVEGAMEISQPTRYDTSSLVPIQALRAIAALT